MKGVSVLELVQWFFDFLERLRLIIISGSRCVESADHGQQLAKFGKVVNVSAAEETVNNII